MNDPKKATVVRAVAKPEAKPAAPKPPRKPKIASMTLVQKAALLDFVKQAKPDTPDATLAHSASEKFGRVVAQQTVADYRKQLGLRSVRQPSAAQVRAYVALLEAELERNGIALPDMPEDAPDSPEQAAA